MVHPQPHVGHDGQVDAPSQRMHEGPRGRRVDGRQAAEKSREQQRPTSAAWQRHFLRHMEKTEKTESQTHQCRDGKEQSPGKPFQTFSHIIVRQFGKLRCVCRYCLMLHSWSVRVDQNDHVNGHRLTPFQSRSPHK